MIKRYLAKRDNPWELLLIGCFFLLPGAGIIIRNAPVTLIAFGTPTRFAHGAILSVGEARIFGAFGILVGLTLVILYFYVRASSAREQ